MPGQMRETARGAVLPPGMTPGTLPAPDRERGRIPRRVPRLVPRPAQPLLPRAFDLLVKARKAPRGAGGPRAASCPRSLRASSIPTQAARGAALSHFDAALNQSRMTRRYGFLEGITPRG